MDLMRYLPWRVYHDEEHVADFQRAIGYELSMLQYLRDDYYRQMRPSTSTWGLAVYEGEYGITPDPGKDREQRLERWKAKKRGRGTTTTALLRQTAEDLTGFPTEVLEFPEEDRFEIVMELDPVDVPDLRELIEVIEEIKPAHLAMYFTHRTAVPSTVYGAALTHAILRVQVPLRAVVEITAGVTIEAFGFCHTMTILQIGGVTNYG